MMHSLGSTWRMRLIILPTYLAWPWATSTQKYWAPASRRASTRSISDSEVPTETKVAWWQRRNISRFSSTVRKRWSTPMPPRSPMKSAMASSVTVSMFEVMMGSFSVSLPLLSVMVMSTMRRDSWWL